MTFMVSHDGVPGSSVRASVEPTDCQKVFEDVRLANLQDDAIL